MELELWRWMLGGCTKKVHANTSRRGALDLTTFNITQVVIAHLMRALSSSPFAP